jgi:hypothetical protein
LIPTILPRVGAYPFVESAEEIRLLISQLLCKLLKTPSCANVIPRHIDEITSIMVGNLTVNSYQFFLDRINYTLNPHGS